METLPIPSSEETTKTPPKDCPIAAEALKILREILKQTPNENPNS